MARHRRPATGHAGYTAAAAGPRARDLAGPRRAARHRARPAGRPGTLAATLTRQRVILPATAVAVAGLVTIGGAVAVGGTTSVVDLSFPTSGQATVTQPGLAAEPVDHGNAGGPVEAPVGAPTTGSIAPSPADAAAIATAVRTSEFTSLVPPDAYEVTGTRLAASDPTWAWTQLRPVAGTVDPASAVLHRTADGWRLLALGTFEVGCSIVPPQVRADLALDCPSTAATYPA